MGAVVAWVLVVVMIGPEYVVSLCYDPMDNMNLILNRNHGSHFEKHKAAFEEGAAQDDAIVESEDNRDEKESTSSHPTSFEGEKERPVME
jgi:SHS family lactate transporter-like MFS transporter